MAGIKSWRGVVFLTDSRAPSVHLPWVGNSLAQLLQPAAQEANVIPCRIFDSMKWLVVVRGPKWRLPGSG